MRGKRARRRVRRGRGRIIPAHAGQTRRYCVWSCADPDHPRACGANGMGRLRSRRRIGSSPRMRGKHLAKNLLPFPARIIPAHAGQTSRESSTSSPASDHPRACGANCVRRGPACLCTGSSPRMRGKRSQSSLVTSSSRIIPAHAGQTSTTQARRACVSDHPRACGANVCWIDSIDVPIGSSPRMRGKQTGAKHRVRRDRIIPAHAGQTRRRP